MNLSTTSSGNIFLLFDVMMKYQQESGEKSQEGGIDQKKHPSF